jgi:hypothetical protein
MGDVYWVGVFLGLGVAIGIVVAGILGASRAAVVASVLLAAAALLAVAGLLVAVLAFIPLVGFVEALALPAVGARLRRREPERYAGLRSLARD